MNNTNTMASRIQSGELTRWGSDLNDITILVRDDSDEGGNKGFSWSPNDGETGASGLVRWYSSEYQTVVETAALGHGCWTGTATSTDNVHNLGLHGSMPKSTND